MCNPQITQSWVYNLYAMKALLLNDPFNFILEQFVGLRLSVADGTN